MTTSRTDRIRLATGVELHYVESGDPAADETLLFLHGWPDSSFSFSRVVAGPRLSRHRCLAIDQRGFGDSERPDGGYAIEDLARDAVAFLDALGVDRATLVGHSMGTFVARRAAELFRDRVQRLILIGTARRADNEVVRQVAEQVAGLTDPVPEEFVREFQSGTTVRALPEDFFDGIVAESRKAPARVWQGVLNGLLAFDDGADLASLQHPTLVLGGAEDPLFPPEEQEALADALPNARFTLHAGVGHCLNWEYPERVAWDVAAYLRATPPLQLT